MTTDSDAFTATNASSVGSAEPRDIFVFHTAYDPSPPPEYSRDHSFVVWAPVAAFIVCYESLQVSRIPCVIRLIGTPRHGTAALERQGVYEGANACVMVKPWQNTEQGKRNKNKNAIGKPLMNLANSGATLAVNSYPTIRADLFVQKRRGDSIIHHEASFIGDAGSPPNFTHVMDCAKGLASLGYRALTDWTPPNQDAPDERVRGCMGRWRHFSVNGFGLGPDGGWPVSASLPRVKQPRPQPELSSEIWEEERMEEYRNAVV
ncbi:hypothetical protein VTK26DRAFT_1325 [Humicola hyalothermophila]